MQLCVCQAWPIVNDLNSVEWAWVMAHNFDSHRLWSTVESSEKNVCDVGKLRGGLHLLGEVD
jgi:hypothetical protein